MGKLILVPTPIGNLEDITLRAIRILKEADAVLAEDTRTTGNLLKHFEIHNKLISYHQNNEHKVFERLVEELKGDLTYALVTDAGTPGISDPGFLLTRACIEADIEVECLPGATAFVPALVVSGFPCEKFSYEGFIPHKKGRQSKLLEIIDAEKTIVFYESPHRLLKTLAFLNENAAPERRIAVCRELSKKFEEIVRGPIAEVLEHFTTHTIKGEFVCVIEPKG